MTLSAKKSDYTIATSNPKRNTVHVLTPTVQTRILTSSTTKKVHLMHRIGTSGKQKRRNDYIRFKILKQALVQS
jgi:hypothetical protein